MCYHLDIYRSITNDRIENLRKEANGNRKMNDNEVIDWWISTNMLFIFFFSIGERLIEQQARGGDYTLGDEFGLTLY